MPKNGSETSSKPLSLTGDEVAIIEFYRVLQLDREEAMRRLAAPPVPPILPQAQELQSNMAAVAQDLLPPDPTTDFPVRR